LNREPTDYEGARGAQGVSGGVSAPSGLPSDVALDLTEPSRSLRFGPSEVQGRPLPRLLTLQDVAELLAVDEEVVRSLANEKRLRTLRIGSGLRVRPEALRAFIEASEE
jgi:excisionase family DNA binding protein